MKPCCRLLIYRRKPGFFGFSSPKWQCSFSKNSTNSNQNRTYCSQPSGNLGAQCVADHTHKHFRRQYTSWGNSRIFLEKFNGGIVRNANSFAVKALPHIRNKSSRTEAGVNDKNPDSIYGRGGIDVKPLIEKIDEEENVDKDNKERKAVGEVDNVNNESSVSSNEAEAVSTRGVGKEAEKEAWKVLANAIVTYCGSPVGTMAANDPTDTQPLNYDQVFIRDFVPSALAFLLKGDKEIVKNFLLHNLQLQVINCLVLFT